MSTPFTEKRSLIETGRPCRGPRVVPVFARYSSICFAVAKASSKKISVQQVVSWCASAARLANALVNSSEDSSAEESLRRRTVISVSSVSASSAGVSMRRIYASASGCVSAEGTGERRHSGGMRASWLARFSAARSWYVWVGIEVAIMQECRIAMRESDMKMD